MRHTGFLLALLAFTSAEAKVGYIAKKHSGGRSNFSLGLASTTVKQKGFEKNTQGQGFTADIGTGYDFAYDNKVILGIDLFGSYNSAKAKMYQLKSDKEATETYNPGFSLGVGVLAGRLVSETTTLYLGSNVEMKFPRLDNLVDKDKNRKGHIIAVTPKLGFKNRFHEKMSWGLEAGYAFTLGMYKELNSFKGKKPRSFVAKAGATYHF